MRVGIAFFLALSLLPGLALAEVVTAQWQLETPMNTYSGIGGCGVWQERGQTFLAEQSGQLLSASMRMYRNGNSSVWLRVSIYSVDESTGLPTGEPIYFEDYAADDLNIGQPPQPETYVFSGNTPVLQAGQRYALVMTDADAAGSGPYFTLNGLSNSLATYAGGAMVQRGCGTGATWAFYVEPQDFAFRVTVDETVATASASWGALKSLYDEDGR